MFFYRLMRVIFWPINFLYPTKIVNRKNFDKVEGAVVICNHYAVPDTLIPASKLYKKELHVLAKAEAFKSKIGNWFLRKVGAIPVHRGEADITAFKEVLKVLKQNKKLALYPEGTRNKKGTEEMGEFKQGAARFAIKAKVPVLPMMYYKMHKLFSRNYLYIGEPIYLDKYYGTKSASDYIEATEIIHNAMLKIREDLNAYVEEHNPRLAKKHKKELAKQKAKEEADALKEAKKNLADKADLSNKSDDKTVDNIAKSETVTETLNVAVEKNEDNDGEKSKN